MSKKQIDTIRLVYKQKGEWDYYASKNDYDILCCSYTLDIDKTIKANSTINSDVLIDYISNNILNNTVAYTDSVTYDEINAHTDDLSGLNWDSYEYYVYANSIYCNMSYLDYYNNVINAIMDYDRLEIAIKMI